MRNKSSPIKWDIALESKRENDYLYLTNSLFQLCILKRKKKNSSALYSVGSEDDSSFMSFHFKLTFLTSFSFLIYFKAGNTHLQTVLNFQSPIFYFYHFIFLYQFQILASYIIPASTQLHTNNFLHCITQILSKIIQYKSSTLYSCDEGKQQSWSCLFL